MQSLPVEMPVRRAGVSDSILAMNRRRDLKGKIEALVPACRKRIRVI